MIRSFLPVGQGAFYCERFEKNDFCVEMNIIYDCGSNSGKEYIKRAIEDNFEKKERIDALFISHFDTDHINGIEQLLKYCDVKHIFLPFVAQRDRELQKLNLKIKGVTDFEYKLLTEPEYVMKVYNVDIIFVKEEGNEDIDEYYDEKIQSRIVNSGENIIEKVIDRKLNNVNCKWELIPFNYKENEKINYLYEGLFEQFGREVKFYELSDIWLKGSEGDRKKIREAYKKVPGGFNSNSMTLFSGTAENIYINYLIEYCSDGVFNHCFKKLLNAGCLYTGDYYATGKDRWKKLKDNYQIYWEKIGCIQLPHHGSVHGYNENFLSMKIIPVISAGTTNRNNHPHASVIKKLTLNKMIPYVVTEKSTSKIEMKIDIS